MKSFIPWIGGKSLLAKKITSLFPEDTEHYNRIYSKCTEKNGEISYQRRTWKP